MPQSWKSVCDFPTDLSQRHRENAIIGTVPLMAFLISQKRPYYL